MASFTVVTGATDTAAKSVSNNDTGTIQADGTLSAATAITWSGGSAAPGVVIDNAGTINASTRGIDTSGSFTTGSITLENEAGARFIASGNDAFRINTNVTNGTITVDNAGLLVSGAVDASGHVVAGKSGQALDFQAITGPSSVINITNETGGVIGSSGDDAIRPGSGTVTITNDGLIDATQSGSRAIHLHTDTLNDLVSFTLVNQADGVIQSQGDAVQLTADVLSTNATYVVTVDNAGLIQSTGPGDNNGQGLDFDDLGSTSGHIHIINEVTGQIFAADADAIRPGQNALIDNFGHIFNNNSAGDSGDDGIDFQGNGGGVVNNHSTGVIDGVRHGITGDLPATINNDGTIIGELGSGINMDTPSTSVSTVTNNGTIIGHGGFLDNDHSQPVDGDGVDIDGLVSITNTGTIQASGVHVDGELQEALAIGGGTVENSGTITSFERAITVDDSNLGPAFGAFTLDNSGLIHGGNGEAISITGTFADTITNAGTIDGSIATGGGNDVFNAVTGSSVHGIIDLGDGTDTLNLMGSGHGSIGNLANVETVNFDAGSWTLGLDNHFAGTIDGFSNIDTIDLSGIGQATAAKLGADNTLTLTGGSGGSFTLHLDPGQSFAGEIFQVSSDSMGGTELTVAKVINGGNGSGTLTGTAGNDVISGGNGADVINSGNGNDILSGGNGSDTLQVGTGNDTLTGGNGSDKFVFGPSFGQDVITDFHNGDTITFNGGTFANFQAVQADMHQVGANTVIEMDANHSVTLMAVSEASLHSSDFLLV